MVSTGRKGEDGGGDDWRGGRKWAEDDGFGGRPLCLLIEFFKIDVAVYLIGQRGIFVTGPFSPFIPPSSIPLPPPRSSFNWVTTARKLTGKRHSWMQLERFEVRNRWEKGTRKMLSWVKGVGLNNYPFSCFSLVDFYGVRRASFFLCIVSSMRTIIANSATKERFYFNWPVQGLIDSIWRFYINLSSIFPRLMLSRDKSNYRIYDSYLEKWKINFGNESVPFNFASMLK